LPRPATAQPSIYWVSKPTLGNETLLVAGSSLASAAVDVNINDTTQQKIDVRFCNDATCSRPVHAAATVWEGSLQVILPTACGPPCWLFVGAHKVAEVNAPEVVWTPNRTHVGGVLRTFGRSLAWSEDATTCISAGAPPPPVPVAAGGIALFFDGRRVATAAATANCYEANFELPASTPAGVYSATVRTAWGESPPFHAEVLPSERLVEHTIHVETGPHGGSISSALESAAKLDGLVNVVLAPKVYTLTAGLQIPNRTTLVGAGTAATTLKFVLPTDGPTPACYPKTTGGGGAHEDGAGNDNGDGDGGVGGPDCHTAAILGAGDLWGVVNMSVVLVHSPPETALIWVPPTSTRARFLNLNISLLQANISNNALLFQGTGFKHCSVRNHIPHHHR
jgi:hypothetical protein